MSTQFKPLETEFKSNGFIYKQVKREGLVAMYILIDPDDNKECSYEVFEIQQTPAGFAGPKKYPQPARETIPVPSMWGKKAFSPLTRVQAEQRFKELCDKANTRCVSGPLKSIAAQFVQ